MRRGLTTRATLLALAAGLALPPAQSASPPRRGGTCLSGNCVNGEGSVRVSQATYTGRWAASEFVAGTYTVTYDTHPDQSFQLTVDGQGLPVQGAVQRGRKDDMLRDPSLFNGSFARVWDPFTRRHLPRYAQGRYTDPRGVVYEGDFDFVPGTSGRILLAGGFYIFQGVRIDEELDEVSSGLYISDWADADVRPGDNPAYLPLLFHRARPDYIAKLQDDLRNDLERVNAEEAAKLAKERASRESWNTLFTAALGVTAVVGVARYASRSSSGSSTVSALGDTLSGKQSSSAANSRMVSELRERAKTDPALAKRIGNASDAELGTMLQQAGRSAPAKMTVAEYRAASGRPAGTTTTATDRRPPVVVAAVDKAATDKASVDKMAADKAASDKAARDKREAERAAEQAQAEKEAKERTERLAAERARKKAEIEAARKAEREAEELAKRNYLRELAAGTRLHARTCPGGEGQYYVVGLVPKIKPERVGCVDLHYRAKCDGSTAYTDGVGTTFLGAATDCFMGDTYKIEPKPACPLSELRVTVREMRACGE